MTLSSWSASFRIHELLAALLIAAHLFLAVCSASLKSPTADEYSYIATGYLYVQTGDFRLDRTHPPLLRLLIGLPLQFLPIELPPLHEELWDTPQSYFQGYPIGWEMLLGGQNDWQRILFWARLPISLLSCLLALVIYLWARRLYSPTAALLALFLYCFSPDILAHARLATMDLGLCFFFVTTLYFFYLSLHGNSTPTPRPWHHFRYWCNRPSLFFTLCGVFLGLTLAAKVTGLLLVPVLLLALLLQPAEDRLTFKPLPGFLREAVILLGLAFITLLLLYGVPFKPFYYPDTLTNVLYKSLQTGETGQNIPGMPHLGHAFYLMGDYSTTGWWYYYFAALALKTPLPVFVLLLLCLLFSSRRWFGITDVLLLSSLFLLLFSSMFNRVNIGIRHILPVYPLLHLYLGRGVFFSHRLWLKAVLLILALWYLAASLSIYPDYLTYFNEAAGGPENGHLWLDDSNLDWGQDLGRLQAIQARFPDEPFYVATNWIFHDQAFGLNAQLLQEDQIQNPPQGVVAVGRHWAIRHRLNPRSAAWFDWLEKYAPVAQVGNSIWVFHFE